MTSSSSAQLRKMKKPMIERRRRERINDCLSKLKKLVLEATKKDESRYSKMEKADILEMTVSYVQSIYRRPPQSVVDSSTVDSSDSGRYADGYRHCADEVARYLADVACSASNNGSFDVIQQKLMRHLTAVLHTKLIHQPDDNDQLVLPLMTSFPPKPEVGTRDSLDSLCDDHEINCSPMSSQRQTDVDDVSSVSPRSLRPVHPITSCSSEPTSPVYCVHSADGSRSTADREALAADFDVPRARSTDCCVWRPW